MKIIEIKDVLILGYGAAFLVLWLFLYLTGKKRQYLFDDLNDEDYPFHEMYCVGYRFSELVHLNYKNKQARNLRKQLGALYDAKYADYYLRVVFAQRFTMALTVMALAAPLYGFTDSVVLFVVCVIGGIATYIYYGKATQDLVQKKKDDIMSEFSDVVSKLALLVNSGMIIVEAWEKVAYSANTLIYQEMQRTVKDMKNGVSITEAITQFGQRCMLLEIRKFSSTVVQGIILGNKELKVMLIQQSSEVWELKKQFVKRKGELADSKLLLPICMTFVGILIMVIVPIFANLGV